MLGGKAKSELLAAAQRARLDERNLPKVDGSLGVAFIQSRSGGIGYSTRQELEVNLDVEVGGFWMLPCATVE